MAQIAWRQQMELSYPPLDDEHKAFLKVVNAAQAAADSDDFSRFDDIFESCYEYARTHFPQEEDVMERISFPDLIPHMKSHQKFIDNISELRQTFSQAKTLTARRYIARQSADFLSTWFLGHILGRDKVYKPYLVRLRNLPPRMNYD